MSLGCHSCAQTLESGERHYCREMLEYVLNTSTNVFYRYCPGRQGLRGGAVVRSRCLASRPSPTTYWTGRGPINEGIMFGELSVVLFVFFLRSVHGCMGMDV